MFLILTAFIQLIILVILFTQQRIEVPRVLLQYGEKWLERNDLYAIWSDLSVDLTGGILINDLKIHHTSGDLVLSTEALFLDINPFSIISGWGYGIEEVALRNASFYTAAVVSASGLNEPAVVNIHLNLHRQGHLLHLKKATMRSGPIHLTAEGAVNLLSIATPVPDESEVDLDLPIKEAPDWIDKWYQSGQLLARLLTHTKKVSDISVHLHCEPNPNGTQLNLRAWLAEGILVETLTLRNAQFNAAISTGGEFNLNAWNLRVQSLRIGKETGIYGLHAHSSSASIRWPTVPVHLPFEFNAAATKSEISQTDLGPLWANFKVDPSAKSITGDISFIFSNLAQHIQGYWKQDSGLDPIQLSLQVPLQPLLLHPKIALPEVLEIIQLEQPARLDGTLYLKTPLTDSRFFGTLEINDLIAKGSRFAMARGFVEVDQTRFLFSDAQSFNPGGQVALGSFVQYFKPLDFRILARGTAYPQILHPILDAWWERIWESIEILGDPVYGDVEVFGRWRATHLIETIVYARGENVSYKGRPVQTVELDLTQKTGFVKIPRLQATAADGTFSGSLIWLFPRDKESPAYNYFDLTSTVPLDTLVTALGQEPSDFSWLSFTEPPAVILRGSRREQRDDQEHRAEILPMNLIIEGSTNEPFFLNNLPLDSMQIKVSIDSKGLRSESLDLGAFGGSATGFFEVQDYRDPTSGLTLEISGNAFSYNDVTQWLRSLKGNAAGESDGVKTGELPGKVDFSGAVSGARNDIASFTGSGSFLIQETDFGKVRLLGPMSRLLDSIGLGFSSFKLDQATSSIRLFESGVLTLPDLSVTGPSIRIDASGDIFTSSNSLDFDVKVFFMDTPTPTLRGLFGSVLRPFAHALELRLTGLIDDPSWRFKHNPFNFLIPAETVEDQ